MGDVIADILTGEISRYFLAGYFSSVAVFYTLRILIMTRREQSTPVFSGVPGSAQHLTHLAFRMMRALILIVCVARLFAPGIDTYLGVISPMWRPEILLTGMVMMTVCFGCVVYLNFYMGRAWRSGTRDDENTHLIVSGPFALCRHPMMLCVQAAQFGFFLALPSLFTFACLLIGITAIQIQVRIEERVLARRHGAAYADYRARVPRWPTGRNLLSILVRPRPELPPAV